MFGIKSRPLCRKYNKKSNTSNRLELNMSLFNSTNIGFTVLIGTSWSVFIKSYASCCILHYRYETLTDDSPNGNTSNPNQPAATSFEEKAAIKMQDKPSTETSLKESNTAKNYESTASSEAGSTPSKTLEFSSQENCGQVRPALLKSNFSFLFQWTTDYTPGKIPFYSLLISTLTVTIVIIMCLFGQKYFYEWWFIIIFTTLVAITLFSLLYIVAFNQDCNITTFKVSKLLY